MAAPTCTACRRSTGSDRCRRVLKRPRFGGAFFWPRVGAGEDAEPRQLRRLPGPGPASTRNSAAQAAATRSGRRSTAGFVRAPSSASQTYSLDPARGSAAGAHSSARQYGANCGYSVRPAAAQRAFVRYAAVLIDRAKRPARRSAAGVRRHARQCRAQDAPARSGPPKHGGRSFAREAVLANALTRSGPPQRGGRSFVRAACRANALTRPTSAARRCRRRRSC